MGSEELRREYESMTGRTAKPASASTNLPGPVLALSDWLFTGRNGVSLFATGLAMFIITAVAAILLAILITITMPHTSENPGGFILLLAVFAVQGIAAILTIVALFTMLAGVIRIGTNADARPNDRTADRTSQR